MTQFTVALITMLVAGIVSFGKADICRPGEVGVARVAVSSTNGLLCDHIRK